MMFSFLVIKPSDLWAVGILIDNYSRQFRSYSNVSIQWLECVSKKDIVFIQHALNGGEKQLRPYFVDGYAEMGVKNTCGNFLDAFFTVV